MYDFVCNTPPLCTTDCPLTCNTIKILLFFCATLTANKDTSKKSFSVSYVMCRTRLAESLGKQALQAESQEINSGYGKMNYRDPL